MLCNECPFHIKNQRTALQCAQCMEGEPKTDTDTDIKFVMNPFERMISIVHKLYPGTKALIQFNPFLPVGRVTFPDDGGIPLIDISTNIPLEAVIETMAHEIAHVVAGKDSGQDDHGAKWEAIFTDINKEWERMYLEDSAFGNSTFCNSVDCIHSKNGDCNLEEIDVDDGKCVSFKPKEKGGANSTNDSDLVQQDGL